MTLEGKIAKGIVIGSCALMLYGANYLYHKTGGSICESRIRASEHNIELYKLNKEKCGKIKEVFEDVRKEFGYSNSEPTSFSCYMDNLIIEYEEQIKDTEKKIEKLTQKREIHQKRKINPFYKVFSK